MLAGRTGIFVLEAFNLFIFLFVFQKLSCEFFGMEKWKTIVGVSLFLIFPMMAFMAGGDTIYEFSMSFTAVGVYFCRKLMAGSNGSSTDRSDKILWYGFIIGLMNGLLLCLDVVCVVFLFSCTIAVTVYMVKNRKGRRWLIPVQIFGFLLPFILAGLYFGIQGGLEDMVKASCILPVRMWLGEGNTSAELLHKAVKCLILLPMVLSGVKGPRLNKDVRFMAVAAGITGLFLLTGDGGWSGFWICILPVGFSMMYLTDLVLTDTNTDEHKYIGLSEHVLMLLGVISLILVISAIPVKNYLSVIKEPVNVNDQSVMDRIYEKMEEYPEHHFLMIDTDMSYSLEADMIPVVKYFCDQTTYSLYDSEISGEVSGYYSGCTDWDLIILTMRGYHGIEIPGYILEEAFLKIGGTRFFYYRE